jgi:hypothetical protein
VLPLTDGSERSCGTTAVLLTALEERLMVNRQVNRRDKSGGGKFNYRPPDAKKMRQRAEQQGGNFDSFFKAGVDSWRPKNGDNQVRILPPTWDDHDHFGYEIWVHGFVGSDESSYLCPKMMKNKKCPICVAAKELKDAGEDEEFNKTKAKKRFLYYIIDRDGDSDMPQAWSVSWTMDRDIAALCINKKTGKVLELDHPEDGYDVSFKRTGQKLNTRYVGLQIDRDASAIDESDKKIKKILRFTEENPLSEVLKFYDYEHLDGVINGEAGDEDEDGDRKKKKRKQRDDDEDDDGPRRSVVVNDDDEDEDEDKPRKKRRNGDDEDDEDDDEPKKRRRKKDDDDEDDDSGEDDDDAEDDRKSKKKKRRKDEDDDEDGDDDEEDDDEPKKRRRKKDDDDDPADEDDEDDDEPKKRRRKKDDDEDDDEDDSEDDDDEDKPRRKRRR